MSAGDVLSRSVFPYSNERLIVYLSLDTARPGSSAFNGTLAHEMEHLAHFVVNPRQVGWLDEGLAELASNLIMAMPPPSLARFRAISDVQLTAWSEKPWEARAHYEASYLWARYLTERGGGTDTLADLVHAGGQGLATVDRFLQARVGAGDANSLTIQVSLMGALAIRISIITKRLPGRSCRMARRLPARCISMRETTTSSRLTVPPSCTLSSHRRFR